MDSGHSLSSVSKLQTKVDVSQPEKLSQVEKIEKNEKSIKEELAKATESVVKDASAFMDKAAKQATDLIEDLNKKEEKSINNNIGTNKEPKPKTSILDKWWVLVGAYFLFKLVFGGD